jgi:predicted TPR repeat methyltransferase
VPENVASIIDLETKDDRDPLADMSQDLLQIALEHHHAGRLAEAEAGYRAILQSSPHDPDALGWLGVLTFQAGHAADAVSLLEQALAERPEDPAFWNNLGQAYLAAGRTSHAIWALEVSVGLNPDRADALHAIGRALLQRSEPGDAEEAINRLEQARAAGLDSAELHQHLAIALLHSGRVDEAIIACRRAIERNPEYAEAHYHLGVACRQKGNAAEARREITKAIELKPDYARACEGLAVLEADARNFAAAESLFRRAIALKPNSIAAHQGLGAVLHKLGHEDEAKTESQTAAQLAIGRPSEASANTNISESIAALQKRLTPSSESAALHFRLATAANIAPPPQMPRQKVSALYDRYADLFDEHLRDRLGYRVPELIAEAIASLHPDKVLDILDLGCGTGLCGPLLRPFAATLTGVDLSAPMLEKAKARDVYDHLEPADYLEVLRRDASAFDLLVAADVLIYIGDLAPTFAAAASALRPAGLFAFSVESGSAPRYELNKSTHRYTHSKPYVQRLASMYGFVEVVFTDITVRKEAGQDVPGYLVVLRAQNP